MKVARAESCALEADGLLRVAEQSIESGDAVAMRSSTLPSQREKYRCELGGTLLFGKRYCSPSVFFPRLGLHGMRTARQTIDLPSVVAALAVEADAPYDGNTSFPFHRPSDLSSGANEASTNGFHETRYTVFIAVGSQGMRNEIPKPPPGRTTATAAKSRLPGTTFPTISL